MRSLFGRVGSKGLRGLQLTAREAKENPPTGRRFLSTKAQNNQAEPLVGLLAHGHIPLDQTSAEMLDGVMKKEQRRMRKLFR